MGEGTGHIAPISQHSPKRPGYHDYQAGPNLVCLPEERCSAEEMGDYGSKHSLPGRDPSQPIENNKDYVVRIPGTDILVGHVHTTISQDGLTIQNVTQIDHIFHDGQITRTLTQAPDGAWYVTTLGTGNNIWPFMATMNQIFGGDIFDAMDRQMRDNIRQHHGTHSDDPFGDFSTGISNAN